MYRYVDYHVNLILLNITIPPTVAPAPGPETTPTATNVTEGGIIMKVISMNEDNKGKERSNSKYYGLLVISINHSIQRYKYKLIKE